MRAIIENVDEHAANLRIAGKICKDKKGNVVDPLVILDDMKTYLAQVLEHKGNRATIDPIIQSEIDTQFSAFQAAYEAYQKLAIAK